jgi:hypothetical protein
VSTPDEFHTQCTQTAKALRRLPKDLRRAVAGDVQARVAVPLAGAMRAALTGPYANALQGAVKARVAADPRIVIGGGSRVVSGGARARQLIYGVEFGGGRGRARVAATGRHRGYSRRSTNQFVPARSFVGATIHARGAQALTVWADVILEHLQRGLENG